MKKERGKEDIMNNRERIEDILDKVRAGYCFTLREEVKYAGDVYFLHRLNEDIQWTARHKYLTPFLVEIREKKAVLTPIFDEYGEYQIFGTNGEKEGEVDIPIDDFLLKCELY